MNLEDLEKPIQDIIKLVDKLDERYREKCFEILLNFYLEKEIPITPRHEIEEKIEEEEKAAFLLPIDVRAFLQQHNIPEEDLQKLFLMQKDEARPVYKIGTVKKATAQMQIALLTSLENAIKSQDHKFEFSTEAIRQRCKDHKAYDAANFSATFKKNTELFKSLEDPEHVELSAEGKTELAEVISTVVKK